MSSSTRGARSPPSRKRAKPAPAAAKAASASSKAASSSRSRDDATAPLSAREVAGNHGLLGERLKLLRQEKGLSLTAVAARSGISTSFLSLVENGRSDITISRLIRLAHVYDVSVAELIADEPGGDGTVVTQADQRLLSSPQEGIDVFLITPDTNRKMMAVLSVLAVGGAEAEYASHDGEEFVHVLEGSIEIALAGAEPLNLEAGDSAYFKADRTHAYRNSGKRAARVISVVTPPNW